MTKAATATNPLPLGRDGKDDRGKGCGVCLKGPSHEIFRPDFWPVWIYLGLNGNRFWFLNFKEGSLILNSYFNY
jgi:hypothetical protein